MLSGYQMRIGRISLCEGAIQPDEPPKEAFLPSNVAVSQRKVGLNDGVGVLANTLPRSESVRTVGSRVRRHAVVLCNPASKGLSSTDAYLQLEIVRRRTAVGLHLGSDAGTQSVGVPWRVRLHLGSHFALSIRLDRQSSGLP